MKDTMTMTRRVIREAYVRSSCLGQSRRGFATSSSTRSPQAPPPPPASGAAKLNNRRLILLHGKDTPKFLQGIVTNNVRPDSRAGFFAALGFDEAEKAELNEIEKLKREREQIETEMQFTETEAIERKTEEAEQSEEVNVNEGNA